MGERVNDFELSREALAARKRENVGSGVEDRAILDLFDARESLRSIRKAMLVDLYEIDADDRFHYRGANTDINAGLALIQLSMETTARHCQKVLGLLGYHGPEMSIKPGPRAPAPLESSSAHTQPPPPRDERPRMPEESDS